MSTAVCAPRDLALTDLTKVTSSSAGWRDWSTRHPEHFQTAGPGGSDSLQCHGVSHTPCTMPGPRPPVAPWTARVRGPSLLTSGQNGGGACGHPSWALRGGLAHRGGRRCSAGGGLRASPWALGIWLSIQPSVFILRVTCPSPGSTDGAGCCCAESCRRGGRMDETAVRRPGH